MATREEIIEAIESFVKTWAEHTAEYNEKHYPNLGRDYEKYSIQYGPKNAKIVVDNGTQRSAAGFVNLETGDVLKTASWSAPAKHARGNVLSPQNGMEAIDRNKYIRYL